MLPGSLQSSKPSQSAQNTVTPMRRPIGSSQGWGSLLIAMDKA